MKTTVTMKAAKGHYEIHLNRTSDDTTTVTVLGKAQRDSKKKNFFVFTPGDDGKAIGLRGGVFERMKDSAGGEGLLSTILATIEAGKEKAPAPKPEPKLVKKPKDVLKVEDKPAEVQISGQEGQRPETPDVMAQIKAELAKEEAADENAEARVIAADENDINLDAA